MRRPLPSMVVLVCSAIAFRAELVHGDDAPAVTAPQVMLKLQVVEVSLADLKAAGIKSSVFAPPVGNSGQAARVYAPQTVAAEFQVLRKARALKLLSEPNLATIVGRQSFFESGVEVAVPVVQADNSVKDELQFIGTRVDLLVTSLQADRAALQIRQEISQLNDRGPARARGRTVRSVAVPELEVPLGKTAVLAGLIQEQADPKGNGKHLVSLAFLITPELVEALPPITKRPAADSSR